MFNEADMAALTKALNAVVSSRPTAFLFSLTAEELAAALDAVGVEGLDHNVDPLHCPACDGDHL